MDAKGDEKRAKIVAAAKDEFIKKGFNEANLRDIGAAAGATLGGIYRFFNGKEVLFQALVAPAITAYEEVFSEQVFSDAFPGTLQGCVQDMAKRASEEREAMLLLSHAAGSPQENFFRELAEKAVEALQKQNEKAAKMDAASLKLLLGMLYGALLEIAVQKLTAAQAESYGAALAAYTAAGWERLLG